MLCSLVTQKSTCPRTTSRTQGVTKHVNNNICHKPEWQTIKTIKAITPTVMMLAPAVRTLVHVFLFVHTHFSYDGLIKYFKGIFWLQCVITCHLFSSKDCISLYLYYKKHAFKLHVDLLCGICVNSKGKCVCPLCMQCCKLHYIWPLRTNFSYESLIWFFNAAVWMFRLCDR